MCGRFFADASPHQMAHFLDRLGAAAISEGAYTPRFNIAPSQRAMGLVAAGTSGKSTVVSPQFGVSKRKGAGLIINARAESAQRLVMFREAARTRRCAILASGFYEWQPQPAGPKIPHAIRAQHAAIVGLAGLLVDAEHFVIVTTEASAQMKPIHARMPVLLDEGALRTWLSPATPIEAAFACTAPEHQPELSFVPISRRINSPSHDDAACLEPELAEAPLPTRAAARPRREDRQKARPW